MFQKLGQSFVDSFKLGGAALFPGAGSYLSNQETNDANLRAQREANAANVALWREQAAYNSPIENMKRLEAAGLNPHLAYGQVAESKMATPPTMVAPRREAWRGGSSDLSTLSTHQQVVNMQETNKLIREQNRSAAAEADYKEYENKVLMKQGLLRTDSGLVKTSGRAGDYVKANIVEPIKKAISGSSLWGTLKDSISNTSRMMSESRGKTEYVKRQELKKRFNK